MVKIKMAKHQLTINFLVLYSMLNTDNLYYSRFSFKTLMQAKRAGLLVLYKDLNYKKIFYSLVNLNGKLMIIICITLFCNNKPDSLLFLYLHVPILFFFQMIKFTFSFFYHFVIRFTVDFNQVFNIFHIHIDIFTDI